MGLICNCDDATVGVDDISADDCRTGVAPAYKLLFQRKYAADGSLNTIADTVLTSKTAMAALIALPNTDAARIQCTPEIDNPQSESGAAITYGGGDTTRDSKTITMGYETSKLNAEFIRIPQATVKQLKACSCDADRGDLTAYIVHKNGNISAIKHNAGIWRGIPLAALSVSDLKMGTESTPSMNTIAIEFASGWSDDLETASVDFGRELNN